jgi:uncharacterized membrane protein YfcA
MDFFFTRFDSVLLIIGGSTTGLIDSIAGGGGLITLPLLSSIVGRGAHAIGTNKIVGTTGAAIAFWVCSCCHLREGLMMASGMLVGSFIGARLASKQAEKVVRPALVAVITLLLLIELKSVLESKL